MAIDTSKYGEPEAVTSGSAAPAQAKDYGPAEDLPLTPIDELTGSEVPLSYSGISPDTAMNKSIVSTTDRMKLSLGNLAGNIGYLKTKFQDVKPIDGSENLAVLKDGSWYRVDPENGEIADPWEMAKEYARDMSELTPMLAGMAAGAAATSTGVGSVVAPLAAGAGMAAVRTSLGRVVGTYDATPAEQAYDMAFEGLLNLGGEKVMAGVKPTAKFVAGRLGAIKEAFKDTVVADGAEVVKDAAGAVLSAPKAILKKLFAGYSVGEDNFDTMLEHTPAVKSTMEKLHARGGNASAYHDQAITEQVQAVKGIADNARATLSNIYDSMRNKVLKDVPESFSVNLDTPVYDSYLQAFKNGIGEIVTPSNKVLIGKEAADYVAGGGAPFKFQLRSRAQLAQDVANGADVDGPAAALATSDKGYKAMQEYYREISKFTGGAPRTGQAGMKALLDFKKLATNIAYDIETSEPVRGSQAVKSLITQGRHNFDSSVYGKLKEVGADKAFEDLNKTYGNLSREFAPLLAAKSSYDLGNTKAYEPLLNSFLARPRPGATARYAVDAAIDAANNNGLSNEAAKLLAGKQQVQIIEAAKAFNPIKAGTLKADSLGAAGVGMLQYALYTGNPALIAAAAGTQALRSPMAAKTGVAFAQTFSKGQELLSSMPKKQLNNFLSDPKAISAFTTGLIQAPLVRAKADQAFQQMLMQAQQQGQGNGQ